MVSFDFKKYEIKRSFVENIYKSLQKKYETIFNNKLNFEEKVDTLKELIPTLIKSNDQEDYFKDLLSKLNNLPDLKTLDYKNFIRSIDAVLEKRDNKNFEELNKFLDINNFPQQDVVNAIFDSFEAIALEQIQYSSYSIIQ
jgi:uncharacterized protein YpiB (UPF0302 family)